MEVAGGSGVHEDGPGHVAAVLLPAFRLSVHSQYTGVEEKIFHGGPQNIMIHFLTQLDYELVPGVVRVLGYGADGLDLGGVLIGNVQQRRRVHQTGQIVSRILEHIAHCQIQSGFLNLVEQV